MVLAPATALSSPRDAMLARFAAATPELLARRELLSRVDSKFVVPVTRLDEILGRLGDDYAVLRVPTGEIATYRSLYFDTSTLQCFHDHRRGRRIRHKIRVRHYPDRELSFLEVKTKRNETITDKHRISVPYQQNHLGDRELEFLRGRVGAIAEDLRPQFWINYRRLSLIGLHTAERVTIDLDLEVVLDLGAETVASSPYRGAMPELPRVLHDLDHLAVIEVKQTPYCVRTPVMRAVIEAGLRERSMSKYVTAMALSRPDLRRNRLLPVLRALERT